MKRLLMLLVLLSIASPVWAVDITATPQLGTPVEATDTIVAYDSSATEGSRITDIPFPDPAAVNETEYFLDGTGVWKDITELLAIWPTVAGIPYWVSGTSWGGSYQLVQTVDITGVGQTTDIPSEVAVGDALAAKEDVLGNPAANDYILQSQTDGTRAWVENFGGTAAEVTVADIGEYWSAGTKNVETIFAEIGGLFTSVVTTASIQSLIESLNLTVTGSRNFTGAAAISFGRMRFSGENTSPTTGQLRHDNVVVGLDGGCLSFHNGIEATCIASFPISSLPDTDGQVLTYNATTDKWAPSLGLTLTKKNITLTSTVIASGACSSAFSPAGGWTGITSADVPTGTFISDPTSTLGFEPSDNGGLYLVMWPATDNVYIKMCNNTASSITSGERIINVQVIK